MGVEEGYRDAVQPAVMMASNPRSDRVGNMNLISSDRPDHASQNVG
jgi:hypothetical protein